MVNVRECVLGASGGFFMVGALGFVIDFGQAGSEALSFGFFSLIGTVLMFAGLLMKGYADPRSVRNTAVLVVAAGIAIFIASALLEWDVMEMLILVTCGAYGSIMHALSVRLSMSQDRVTER